MTASRAFAVALVLLSFAACSSAGDDNPDEAITTTSSSTIVDSSDEAAVSIPDFTGDPGSAFCRALRDGDRRPVADPFQPDIDADEVSLRMRALLLRFEELDDLAPIELQEDTSLLVSALRDLDDALDRYGHDLGAAAEAGVDVSFTDDPRFLAASDRIGAYDAQVCT